ncbi:MAG: alpha-2-macroglobulin family protein, partial [Sphingomonadales bacterium]
GELLWQGKSDGQGRALVGDVLPAPDTGGDCRYGQPPLFISARTADDMSFTLSSWGRGIQSYDFNLPAGWGRQPLAAHLVLDRTLARPGDTLHGKLLLRGRTDAGFAQGPALVAPQLRFRHWGSGTDFLVPLVNRLAEWKVPASAPQGDYDVALVAKGQEDIGIGQVQVAEYRLPAMRASISGPAQPAVAATSLPLDLSVTYLAGGGAAGAPVTVRTQVQPRSVAVAGYDGWTFDAEDITPGIVALAADGEDDSAATARPLRAQVAPHTLGPGGALRVNVGPWGPITRPSELVAEMDYADANGEIATASRRIALEPAALRVGLKRDGWIAKADDVRLKLVVLGLDGKPVSGASVKVQLFSRETYSTRKRLVGGFYAFDNARETKALGSACTVRSDRLGLAQCQLAPGVSGEVVALAEVKDAAGRVARATQSLWLAGDDDWWFGGDNGDRMDVVAENANVPAGGTARLQVRMPFRTATTLVTVLHDGVIDSFVTTLSGKDPVVEVPMKAGYAPNVYVEVLAVRGRVSGWRLWLADLARRWNLPWLSRDGAYPTGLVDLSKPSYRLGIAKLNVGWDAHKLAVAVRADQSAYPVRGKAMLAVQVTPPKGRSLPADAEIAVAAVDEALLQLQGNPSWDVLTAMMAQRPLAVINATAQSQVVGKRVFGRKAVAAGGGGGADMSGLTRRDFNPLLGWWGRVKLDAQGRAQLPVALNDSLSSFRLVAVATAGADLFGTGATSIRTSQPLQLLPGIPPVVRDGDAYVAEVLARNTTAKPLPVRLTARMGNQALPPLALTIPAGGAGTARWRVQAPAAGALNWSVQAAGGGQADAVQVAQQVLPAVPDQVLMATLFQAGSGPIPMAPPAGALPGRGGVDIALSRSLGGQLAGVRAAMLAYPYDCIEQQLSRAVALGDKARWDRAAAALPGYLDNDGLVRFFPADWIAGDDELTAYILSLSAQAGWALPDAAKTRMLGGLARFVGGQLQRSHANVLVVDKGSGGAAMANLAGDDVPRRVAALAALARHGAATPALLAGISAQPAVW